MMSWIKAQRGEVSAALAGDAGDEGCLVVRGGHGDLGSSGKGERANETRPRVWMIYADRVNPGQVCESTLGQNTALRLTGYSAAAGGLAGWRAGEKVARFPSNSGGYVLHRGRAGFAAAGAYRRLSSYASAANNEPHFLGVPHGAEIWAATERRLAELLSDDAAPRLVDLLSERFA
jgi:hypothetical protein